MRSHLATAGAGLASGLASLALVWALLLATGHQAWVGPWPSAGVWGQALAVAWLVATLEEGLFRGLLWRWAASRWPLTWVWVGTSLAYAGAHLLPPTRFHQPALAALGLVGAGLCLGWSRWRRGGLGAAWGLHLGWLLPFLGTDAGRCWVLSPQAPWWHGAGYPLGSLAGALGLGALAVAWAAWPWRPGADPMPELPTRQF